MKCAIPSPSIRIFVRAIHALAKLGEYIYIEAEKEVLILKALNSSRSAFVVFKFSRQFFVTYDQKSASGSQICKLAARSLLTVFRSASLIDKSAETCLISMPADMTEVVIQLRCRFSVVRTYNLNVVECDIVDVPYSRSILPCHIGASSKVFSEAVVNFRITTDELTLSVQPTKVIMKNYIEDMPDPKRAIQTELSLSKDEFVDYNCTQSVDLTFSLKDFRTLLQFSEFANYSIDLRYDKAGDPLIASVDYDPLFTADFALATLDVSTVTQATPPPVRNALNASHNISSVRTPAPSTSRKRSPARNKSSESNGVEEGVFGEEPAEVYEEVRPTVSKKVKQVFKRCFETSFVQRAFDKDEILAMDSDDD